jgi:peptidoglycan/LPS O-acetylase OafA/YrhL
MQAPIVCPICFPTRTRIGCTLAEAIFRSSMGCGSSQLLRLFGITLPGTSTQASFGAAVRESPLFLSSAGFLIRTILLREWSSTGTASTKRFYLRRELRIFPAYYAILAVYVVLVSLLSGTPLWAINSGATYRIFFTYTSNWFAPFKTTRIIFFFSWSLATEEQFYLFWPWIIKVSKGPYLPGATMIGLIMLCYGTAFAAAHDLLAVTSPFTRVLLFISPQICLGALGTLLLHRQATYLLLGQALA